MQGHLVIADISGYTRFLTDSELDHANGIVGDLLRSIIEAIQAPLSVVSIEGDAVFMHGEMAEGMVGQTVLESVELLYCSFATALENMVLNTTCNCNACTNITDLGLKIVMHCGEYATTSIGNITTLSGPAVIAVHRLLKNRIIEETGIEDYLLVTKACADDLGVGSIVASWTPHTEEYDHIGAVAGYVYSLADVWEFRKRQKEVKVTEDDAWVTIRGQSTAPPAVIWDHVIDPRKRMLWLNAYGMEVHGADEGRVAAGTEFHCAHGDDELTVFTILDLRPYDYITVMMQFMPGSLITYTSYLMPSGTGTRLYFCADVPRSAGGEAIEELAQPEVEAMYREATEAGLAALTTLADEAVLVG